MKNLAPDPEAACVKDQVSVKFLLDRRNDFQFSRPLWRVTVMTSEFLVLNQTLLGSQDTM